jgi:hypothetical protein
MRVMTDSFPDAATTILSPALIEPDATVPEKPRKSRFGRFTHCTGKRNDFCASAWSTSTPSRYSSSVGPSYQRMRSERDVTLSPKRAESGIGVIEANPSDCAKPK